MAPFATKSILKKIGAASVASDKAYAARTGKGIKLVGRGAKVIGRAAVASDKRYAAGAARQRQVTKSVVKSYGRGVMKHDAIARNGVVALKRGGGAIRSL